MVNVDVRKEAIWSITLIHGTWGRGFVPRSEATTPRWFESGSTFRNQLEANLKEAGFHYEMDMFPWTGSNSIIERDQAARRLSKQLTADANDRKYNLLIAHSHGGNVALRAIRYMDDEAAPFGDEAAPFWIVTMATPFLQVKAPLNRAGDVYGVLPFVLSALVLGIVYLNIDKISSLTGFTFPLISAHAGIPFQILGVSGRYVCIRRCSFVARRSNYFRAQSADRAGRETRLSNVL
jgi:hypothetical protein